MVRRKEGDPFTARGQDFIVNTYQLPTNSRPSTDAQPITYFSVTDLILNGHHPLFFTSTSLPQPTNARLHSKQSISRSECNVLIRLSLSGSLPRLLLLCPTTTLLTSSLRILLTWTNLVLILLFFYTNRLSTLFLLIFYHLN